MQLKKDAKKLIEKVQPDSSTLTFSASVHDVVL